MAGDQKRIGGERRGIPMKGLFHQTILLLLLFVSIVAPVFAGPVEITGTVINGSTGKPARALNLSLYTMDDSMNLVGRLDSAERGFRFRTDAKAESYLLTGEFDRQIFFQTVKPGQPVTFNVYEGGAGAENVQVTSMHVITKLGDALQVETMYVMGNDGEPGRTFSSKNLTFLLPKEATKVDAFMRLENANLAVPLEITPRGDQGGYGIDMSIRPGNSTITFRYTIPGQVFMDRMPDIKTEGPMVQYRPFRIVSWKPEGSLPEVKGATSFEEMTVPHLGRSFKVNLEEGKTVAYDFSSGGKQVYLIGGTPHVSPIPGGLVGSLVAFGMGISLTLLLIHLVLDQKRKEKEAVE